MYLHSLITLGFAVLAFSLPTTSSNEDGLGLKFNKKDGELPTLTLPYATYQASEHDPNGDASSPNCDLLLMPQIHGS